MCLGVASIIGPRPLSSACVMCMGIHVLALWEGCCYVPRCGNVQCCKMMGFERLPKMKTEHLIWMLMTRC